MAQNSKKLVIVESPAKAKTINKILGKDYQVKASVGHVIDLPKTKFGVDVDNGFTPQFVTIKGKSKIINELKKAASEAGEVLLATDPDREGEAIAYHISETLKKVNSHIQRIEFNEITQNAVLNALKHPRAIDDGRVNAQQARRVMDRIVGYEVSPLLWQTIFSGLSAGRVQSVALRLMCEREDEIDRFEPVEYWTVDALLATENKNQLKARLVKIGNNTLDPQRFRIKNKDEAARHENILKKETYHISEIEQKTVEKKASPPFITSTLQQEASRRFRMTTSRVMSVAQQLYEGIDLGEKGEVGLITYMRTDSTRISSEALQKAREFISGAYGPDYLPAKPLQYGKKKSAQDAHEAIRPTYIHPDYEPRNIKKHLSADQFKLYELIWKRLIASQMKPAKALKTTINIKAGQYLFRTEGEIITFQGYLLAYQEQTENEEENNQSAYGGTLPDDLRQDQVLSLLELMIDQRFTQPPPRYSESTLVKTLDKLGIGRPSTYAQIISTLFYRKYADRKERALQPTELGRTVNKLLVANFPDIFNVKFTAEMEETLDRIEQQEVKYLDSLQRFYGPFKEALDHVKEHKKEIKKDLQEKTEISCEKCGRPMVIRWGRNGRFYA
ncbi:MAG: type I DNA topoisomerase, partial [Calditrichia bacterium]